MLCDEISVPELPEPPPPEIDTSAHEPLVDLDWSFEDATAALKAHKKYGGEGNSEEAHKSRFTRAPPQPHARSLCPPRRRTAAGFGRNQKENDDMWNLERIIRGAYACGLCGVPASEAHIERFARGDDVLACRLAFCQACLMTPISTP